MKINIALAKAEDRYAQAQILPLLGNSKVVLFVWNSSLIVGMSSGLSSTFTGISSCYSCDVPPTVICSFSTFTQMRLTIINRSNTLTCPLSAKPLKKSLSCEVMSLNPAQSEWYVLSVVKHCFWFAQEEYDYHIDQTEAAQLTNQSWSGLLKLKTFVSSFSILVSEWTSPRTNLIIYKYFTI